ncbi:MAG: putative dihydrouridine synthase [Streblomastix strix]|uniref:tRNA-dihydrouridine synthase n=1 Tax=Streblomastix strix TaxID=222440 RepID=A0A5J4X1J7_9EUKA|nr:MAG: putative dihydrouridine synthase [Streblomastix strix]
MLSEIFNVNKPVVTFLAPMVRYSRLPFRLLTLRWGTSVVYSPMFIASGFYKSKSARDADFTTSREDQPLVVQFASNNPVEFMKSAEIVANHCACVDLNCGCPQKWANDDCLGAEMIRHAELIQECVRTVKSNIPNLHVSVKIRLCTKERETIRNAGEVNMKRCQNQNLVEKLDDQIKKDEEYQNKEEIIQDTKDQDEIKDGIPNIRQISFAEDGDKMYNFADMHATLSVLHAVEAGGASYITVHGRRREDSSSGTRVSTAAIALIKSEANIPVVANGDIFTPHDCREMRRLTGADGLMSARGLLQNPALFGGFRHPPCEVLQDLESLGIEYGLPVDLKDEYWVNLQCLV